MTVEITVLISAVSAVCGILLGIRSARRADKDEIEKRTKEMTTIMNKLDGIGTNVLEVRKEIISIDKRVQMLTEKVAVLEQSTKAAHKRIDKVERG